LKGGSPLKHAESCTKAHENWEKDMVKFEERFPAYCRTCEGWGGKWEQFDPSPAGIMLSPGTMTDFDPCPNCVDQGVCPRCKQTLDMDMKEEYYICHDCNWTDEDNGEDYGVPPYPECHCDLLGSSGDEKPGCGSVNPEG
jgi:hypothetical protein